MHRPIEVTAVSSPSEGQPDLNPIDMLTLHNIHNRDNEQRRIGACFRLNIEDVHTVTYFVK